MPTNPDARQRLVTATAEMLSRRGLNATSVREVAKAADAPLGSTYHYFPGGKQQRVVEALQYAGEQFGSALSTAFSECPVKGLRSFFAMWRKNLLRSDFRIGCPVLAVSIEEPSDEAAQEALKTADVVFAQWESLLCKSFKEAGMANKDAAQIAVMTISAFEGVAAMCRSRRSVHPLDAVSAQLESTIAAAIANGKNR